MSCDANFHWLCAPYGARRLRGGRRELRGHISIHALRMERDAHKVQVQSLAQHFNPRAPHGARLCHCASLLDPIDISIHALRMERDKVQPEGENGDEYFNPRAPHGARPAGAAAEGERLSDFNPRAPHGARRGGSSFPLREKLISIHALRMERDDDRQRQLPHQAISIHALRMERDISKRDICISPEHFNPRAPHGARR